VFSIFTRFSDILVFQLLGLDPDAHYTRAIHFFIEDVTKIFFLLAIIIFAVSYIRTFFPPEKVRDFLAGYNRLTGHVLAAILGVVTPFCSCSACPLFIGFVEAGVPLGVTFSFLISSPMVNEIALVMLLGLFGWKIAGIYLLCGISIAIIAGIFIGALNMERFVADYVWKVRMGKADVHIMNKKERILYAREHTRGILKKIWPYVLGGIGVGALIHGYVPEGFLLSIAGKNNPFSVPMAVILGIPLYANAAGIIPIVNALIEKGLSLGTALSFMMAVTALSVPEMVILSQVLKKELIAVFVGIVGISIIAVGYLFDLII
jgi:uncharacterized membrane protein YraQ (UPF0718 family)